MTDSRVAHDRHRSSSTHRRRRSQPLSSKIVVWTLAAAAGVAGALAGAHPTGTTGIDPLYAAGFAVLVTLACSLASRSTWLFLTVVGVGMSRSWLLLPAVANLGVAFGAVFPRRRMRRLGAVVGALGSQIVLRWPHVGFQGLTAIVAIVAVAPCLVSAYRRLGRRGRRRTWLALGLGAGAIVVLAVPVFVGGLLARRPVSAGIAETQAALQSESGGSSSTATAQLRSATNEFASASSDTGSWWTRGAGLIPIVAQQGHALRQATGAARNLTAAAQSEQADVNLNDLRYSGGRINLPAVEALGQPLDQLTVQLASAQRQLGSTGSPWLVEPIQSRLVHLGNQLTKARHSTDLASEAVKVSPGLLGGQGTRHYFVAFEQPAESRGMGGFIGAYGLLTVSQGKISLTASGHTTNLNDGIPDGQRHILGPPGYLARYEAFQPNNFFQDLTYSPDLPTVSQVIDQMYPQSGGQPIDGVLAIDPVGLASLLQFTGPVSVPGLATPLTPANAADILLKTQYLQSTATTEAEIDRHDLLQSALSQAFNQLLAGSLPGPRTVSADLDPTVLQGHLLFWSNHPAEDPLLRQVGLAGVFPPTDGGDLLAVTTQNAANNKIDSYLSRTIDDSVTYNPGTGAEDSTVTVSLHNAASAALAPDISSSYAGSGLPPGTNQTWMSVYSPLLLTGATNAGAPLRVGSGNELGVHAYSAYVNIPPGGTVTVVLHLTGAVAPGTYRLNLHQQPMVNPDHTTVEVQAANGWYSTGPDTWAPGPDVDQSQTVRFGRVR